MRYPVGTGTSEDFTENWYLSYQFGNPPLHEGVDINLKSGGNTDLGQPLYAISSGKVVYYHYSYHPSSGFGRHLVYKIDGPWGSRWVHYAHCHPDNFIASVQNIEEGQMIARIGNSGTQLAHLHMSIFKVDPTTIGGIDRLARNTYELNTYWENPIVFIETWLNSSLNITDETYIPQIGMKVREIRDTFNNLKSILDNVRFT